MDRRTATRPRKTAVPMASLPGIEVIEGDLEIIVIRELPIGQDLWVEIIDRPAPDRARQRH